MPFSLTAIPRHVYRVCWGGEPLQLAAIERIRERPGRFDDPDLRYRVLYTAHSMAAAFVEVLADFREDARTLKDWNAIEGADEDELRPLAEAINEYLQPRSAALLIAPDRPDLVDLVAAGSRTEIEIAFDRKHLKVGDFLASDVSLPRRASRLIYNQGHVGIASPSAEATAIQYAAPTYSVFEASPGSSDLRVNLVARSVDEALNEQIALAEAIDILGLY